MAGGFPNYVPLLEGEGEGEEVYDLPPPYNAFIGHEEDSDEDDPDYEGEDEDAAGDEEQGFVPPADSPRVSSAGTSTSSSQDAAIDQNSVNTVEENEESRRRREGGETSSQGHDKGGSGENAREEELNRSDIDGLFCPICMEAWTNDGDHQVCCLPCGHLYGVSCIKRWLQQRKNSGKCPQCNRKCTLKDVRVIYASQIVVVDQELQQKVRSLEAKCASFEKKPVCGLCGKFSPRVIKEFLNKFIYRDRDWHKKEVEWQKREADLSLQVHKLTERTSHLKGLLGGILKGSTRLFLASEGCQEQDMFGHNLGVDLSGQGSLSGFVLQKKLQVDGAKFFDVDASGQTFLIARRLSGMGGTHVLTKLSLIAPHESEIIHLPVCTKAVRDLSVSPHGRLALVASLGKKLSVISTESNNMILSYDLPAPAWSCSWDFSSSHYAYTGLQNGMLLMFDMRQTSRPLESIIGLTGNPIHTVHSLKPDLNLPSGVRSVLTASSVGLCEWKFGVAEERPFLVPESENQGVCIACAYCPSSNDIVASFRPKVEMPSDMAVSQLALTPATSSMGQVQGFHVIYKSLGNRCYQKLAYTYANVHGVRLPRSTIIDWQNDNPLFACGDEVTSELVLQELPSLTVVQRLKSGKHPIRDLKFTHDLSSGLLSCLSEDVLQLFSAKLL